MKFIIKIFLYVIQGIIAVLFSLMAIVFLLMNVNSEFIVYIPLINYLVEYLELHMSPMLINISVFIIELVCAVLEMLLYKLNKTIESTSILG